ncbi:ABC transporter permease [Mangrovibacterium diazotrophicum]|uniref:Lipoprotein-releasing system permease protein n=1 Tax=Mangrovibacterium diazotrophicum TaxID=1261403 RepID=A0A419VVM7_9BACT|nr:FtsX-like permease family protein [Mangrovibacterium diazotrophicum]RKD86161.1 lipoprotein-releasing system permease protein [Mangrovibacterium diazotrophicum]
MNTELFIARRLFSSKDAEQHLSRRIVRLAVAGISLGMVVMILAVAIVTGFQGEVESKVNGFAAHLQIVNYDSNQSYQTVPINEGQPFLEKLNQLSGITHIQKFATKPGIIKAGEEIQGVVLKGISADFDWSFFAKNKIEGDLIPLDSARTDLVWISQQISDLLRLEMGDKFQMYFLNEDERIPRLRRFTVGGIYRSGLEEFDRMFVLIDLRHIQRLNNWADDQISGYEVFVDDLDQVENLGSQVRDIVLGSLDVDAPMLRVVNVKEKYPYIFDWLNLLDMNVWIILLLMVLVAGFNMISGLLVIILERTRMIGILKSMGAANVNIRKIFLYLSAFLVGKGLLWGNIIGILLCVIQSQFKVIHLDPASYYVDTVPVNLMIHHLLLLNVGALLVTLLMLLGPSYLVGRISPEKTIRFD